MALLLTGYGYWTLTKPLPQLKPVKTTTTFNVQAAASKLTWPGVGQSAVGVVGTNILETHGSQTSAPTASTAKIITALNVLRAKPLKPGEQGPTLTLTPNDVAIYNAYVARGGSVVPVVAGEKVTEYQALEAMLLPSANNFADSLAIWAFGSLPAYATSANAYLAQNGLTGTHIGGDASGFAPTTTSTARDLVRLGEIVMQDPVLTGIVGQSSATGIPLTTSIKNVNFLLGTNNIIGIKTGNTDQAGGVYVSAAKATVNNKPVTIVTALVGAPTLFDSLKDSLPLIQSAQANFQPVPVILADAIVGRYEQPWGGSLAANVSEGLSSTAWNGSSVSATTKLNPLSADTEVGDPAGTVTLPASTLNDEQTVTVSLRTPPTKPSAWWRLTHP